MNIENISFPEMMQLFKETRESIRETRESIRETRESIRETRESIKELRESQKETDIRTEKQKAEYDARMEKQKAEYDARMEKQKAEYDARMEKQKAELDASIKKTNQIVGNLGNRLGEYVQEMIKPAVVRLFQERGIAVHKVMPNYDYKKNGIAFEIDLLVINDGYSILIECKSKPNFDDVDKHLDRLDKFKIYDDFAKGKKNMGAIAGFVMDDDVVAHAISKGLYVMVQSGEDVIVLNAKNFEPKYWEGRN